jgi:hypothetical protein
VCALATIALVLGTLAPAPAQASPDTLRRSFGNILQGPLDMLMSPITGMWTLASNLNDIDDSAAVRVVYFLPGWIWLTGLNFGSGGIRTITGALELIPGLVLFPFETDLDPLFDPVEDGMALIQWDNPLEYNENPWVYYNPLVAPFAIHVKFAVDYARVEY